MTDPPATKWAHGLLTLKASRSVIGAAFASGDDASAPSSVPAVDGCCCNLDGDGMAADAEAVDNVIKEGCLLCKSTRTPAIPCAETSVRKA